MRDFITARMVVQAKLKGLQNTKNEKIITRERTKLNSKAYTQKNRLRPCQQKRIPTILTDTNYQTTKMKVGEKATKDM